jgi:hypothetical protein
MTGSTASRVPNILLVPVSVRPRSLSAFRTAFRTAVRSGLLGRLRKKGTRRARIAKMARL